MKDRIDRVTNTMFEHVPQDIDQARIDDSCTRCGGLLVLDDCFDILGDAGEIECRVLRCVQCGDLTDPVILRNRAQPPAFERKKFVKWSSAKLTALARR